jgi:hypothetical protein
MRCPHSCPTFPKTSALTLVEVTLVVTVLLGLISIAFAGMSAYKEGANRAICIHQVANVQKAMRSYCHFQELESGQAIPDLKKRLIVDSKFFARAPFCPSGGTYVFHEGAVPHVGTLFMRCSIPDHAPKGTSSW